MPTDPFSILNIQPVPDGPVIRAPNPTDTPLPPNDPFPLDGPLQDAPTQEEMNPNVDPVPPVEAVPAFVVSNDAGDNSGGDNGGGDGGGDGGGGAGGEG